MIESCLDGCDFYPTCLIQHLPCRQSKLQWVQHLSNLQKINASNIKNHGPHTSPTAVLKTELEKQHAQADDNAHRLHNKAHKAQCAKTASGDGGSVSYSCVVGCTQDSVTTTCVTVYWLHDHMTDQSHYSICPSPKWRCPRRQRKRNKNNR